MEVGDKIFIKKKFFNGTEVRTVWRAAEVIHLLGRVIGVEYLNGGREREAIPRHMVGVWSRTPPIPAAVKAAGPMRLTAEA